MSGKLGVKKEEKVPAEKEEGGPRRKCGERKEGTFFLEDLEFARQSRGKRGLERGGKKVGEAQPDELGMRLGRGGKKKKPTFRRGESSPKKGKEKKKTPKKVGESVFGRRTPKES